MIFEIEVQKLDEGVLKGVPTGKLDGKTIKEILQLATGHDIVIKVNQGMEGCFYICGSESIAIHIKVPVKRMMSCEDALLLWEGTPIVEMIWPPVPQIS